MTAQYRPLFMLAIGITFVYWIISLHNAPYPYPQNIMLSRENLFEKTKPNGIFISVQKEWVYLTAIWHEHEVNYDECVRNNFTGLIRQYRRPLSLLLLRDNIDPNNSWQLLYNHRLDGPITHSSSFYYDDGSSQTNTEFNENNALAILYQLHGKEEIKYMIRFYHIGNYESESYVNDLDECKKISPYTCHIEPSFKYHDIALPGTTRIKSFYVDGSIILYSRGLDDTEFRTILIPENLFDTPKSKTDTLKLKASDPGPTQKIGRLKPFHRKISTFRRVYAVPGVIRVLNVEVTAADEMWTFEVTVVHNSSSSEESVRWRSKKLIRYTPSTSIKPDYDQFDFVRGSSLAPVVVPKPIVVTAKNVTTICIALNNILFTFDYSNTTTTSDSSQQDTHSTEAFIVRSEYLPVLEESPFQVVGTEINANGNLLVLITQENYILIYKRGYADINVSLSARTRKGWFSRLIDADNRQNLINRQEDNWELRMVISSSDLDFLSQSDSDVIAVKILNASILQNDGNVLYKNVLLNLYENGDVATFDLDNSKQEIKFWFIIRKQWLMYLGMLCVVFAFVWNEVKMG